MKHRLFKIAIIAISLAVLNMPLFLLAKMDFISKEQPDFPVKFENYLDISNNNNFAAKKQTMTVRRDGFTGVSLLVYSNAFSELRTIRLRVYNCDNLEKPILNQSFEVYPNYATNSIFLKFRKTIKSSQDKKIIVIATTDKYSDNDLKEFLKNGSNLLNVRPFYKTDSALRDAYYRISQYKPTSLKIPSIPLIYFIFNVLFIFIITEILKHGPQRHNIDSQKTPGYSVVTHLFFRRKRES